MARKDDAHTSRSVNKTMPAALATNHGLLLTAHAILFNYHDLYVYVDDYK